MPDPKINRPRKIGRDWKVRLQTGNDADPYKPRCSACLGGLWPGEAVLVIHKHKMHRHCVKAWVESTFAEVPVQPDEIERNLGGPLGVVEQAKLEREFQEYRQALLERQELRT